MKNILKTFILGLIFAPFFSYAVGVSLDYAGGILQPFNNISSAIFKINSITATSTTNNSTLPRLLVTYGTTTNATSTNMNVSSTFRMGSDLFTDLTGTGLQLSSGALTLNATGDWTGTLDGFEGAVFNQKVSSTSIDTCSELSALMTGVTGTCGSFVLSSNPLLAGFRSNASSTIGGGTGATGLTVAGTATTTDLKVTALTASRLIATASDKLMSSVSALTAWIAGTTNEITVTDDGDGSVTLSLPTTIDLGGKTSFEIPNGTNPAFSATGTIAYDETGKQLLIGTSTSATPRVIRTEEEIYMFSVPSTSATFATGTTKFLPRISEGYTITEIWCGVEGGTSKAITIIGTALTCTTGAGANTTSPTIPTVGAGSTTAAIVAGNTSGVVNWLNVSVRAIYTRQ